MASPYVVAAITGDLKKILQQEHDEIADAARTSVEGESTALQGVLRKQTRDAGLGEGLEKAWRVEIYPRSSKRTVRPAGLVYSKSPKLHGAFDKGGTISVKGAEWMVIPLPGAKQLGLDTLLRKSARGTKRTHWSDLDAAIRRFGSKNIRSIQRGNKILIVADTRVGTSKGATTYRKIGDKQRAQASIPLFLLVKQVRLGRRLDIDSAARTAGDNLYRKLSNMIAKNG